MRRLALLLVLVQAALVAGLAVALRSEWMPLGVPGEWEWQRIKLNPEGLALFPGLVGVSLFTAVAATGYRALSRSSGLRREGFWLLGLAVAATVAQGTVQESAPVGYGLSKWIFALYTPGSSGYYTVAKKQMGEPRRFFADYPGWIARQDALHIGTHPPGLFVVAKEMQTAMEANPTVSRWVVGIAPSSVSNAISAIRDKEDLPRSDAAGLVLTGALTLMACSFTVIPLYLLARSVLDAPGAWAASSFWGLVPSALLFQPAADTAFPLLSTTALALACWATRSGPKVGWFLTVQSGLTMALGMFFTLAFLPVGLVVALVLLSSAELRWSRKAGLIVATGLGFLLGTLAWWWATSANPFVVWWINQKNHGRFYVEYPRSYGAWLLENPIELAIALGLPSTVWAIVGFVSPRQTPRVSWATLLVLAILTISGKNLSEVARLWLPLMPALLVSAGWGFGRVGGRAVELAGSIGLVGLQVLLLEATIQVVYPI